jgi:hypothetical protein
LRYYSKFERGETGGESMTLTINDQRAAIQIGWVVMLFWPLALTGAIALVQRRHLRRPVAFICLGYLVCAGVFFLVGQSEAFTGWIQVAATTPTDKLTAFLIAHVIQKTAASVFLSILPIVWFYKVLTPPLLSSGEKT